MRIKDVATLAGTTVRTVRYYHQLGLLSVPDQATGWRSYGFAHLTRLMRIRWLVESGVPLAEVRHMVRAPGTADERAVVEEDLVAVLASMDERLASLAAQRAAVQTLLERVRVHGRLSPLPPSVVRLYTAMLDRALPEPLQVAVTRERDLLELACYRGALPADVETLVDALSHSHLDEVCDLWEEVYRVDEQAAGHLDDALRARLDTIVERVLDLATGLEPAVTGRLLARARELDRPVIRAAVELAYPSPVYRYLVAAVIARSHPFDPGDRQIPPVTLRGPTCPPPPSSSNT